MLFNFRAKKMSNATRLHSENKLAFPLLPSIQNHIDKTKTDKFQDKHKSVRNGFEEQA